VKKLRPILNFCLLVVFLLSLITGLVKFPELQRYVGSVNNLISASRLSFIHDWSGIALIVLILIHVLFINRARLFSLPAGIGKKTVFKIGGLALVLAAIVLPAAGYVNHVVKRARYLAAVEVREYKGEKLDSINAFRENSIKGPQQVDIENYRLEISGLVDRAVDYSYDEVIKLPKYQKVVELDCVEGWDVKILWEGTLVRDIIRPAGVKPTANTAIFYAVDGYSTSFPLDFLNKNDIIMADKMNGVTLPPERGFPFQLVAEDKWGYKWIKWIKKIELSDDVNYKGYWESRGYNNNGDLSGSKYE
jgi:hypothetical protein